MDFTEEQQKEIEKLIAEKVVNAVAEKEAELKKQHDSDMAQLRISAKTEKENAVKKAKEEANLSAEELAKKQVEEQTKEKDKELAELREYRKKGELTKKLESENVPTMFVNDSRLLNAKEGEIDDVIKTIKEEYSKTLPSGATVSTNVQNVSTSQKVDPKQAKFEEFSKMR